MQTAIKAGEGCVLKLMTTAEQSLRWLRPSQANQVQPKTLAERASGCSVKSVQRNSHSQSRRRRVNTEISFFSNQGTVSMLAGRTPWVIVMI